MNWDNGIRNIRETARVHLNKNGNSIVKNIFGQLRENEKDNDRENRLHTCWFILNKIQDAFHKKFPFFGYYLLCLPFFSSSIDYSNCNDINIVTTVPSNNPRYNENVFFILVKDIELFFKPQVCSDVVIFNSCKQKPTHAAYCNYNLSGIWGGGADTRVKVGYGSGYVEEWSEDNCQTWHKAHEINKTSSSNFKVKSKFQVCRIT